MACKLCAVFLLLFVCQATFSARIPRNSLLLVNLFTTTPVPTITPVSKPEPTTLVPTTTTPKTESNTEKDSSEESSEEFGKIKADFEKLLDTDQKSEFNKIVADLEAAKTLDDGLTNVFKLIEFGMKTMNQTETSTSTPPADTNNI